MEQETKIMIVTTGAIGLSIISAGCAVLSLLSARDSRRAIRGSTERLSRMSHVDIDKAIVDKALSEAVRNKSGEAVREAAARAENRMRADIGNRVHQAVSESMKKINREVANRLTLELSDVERDDIIRDVISQTTDALVEKLEENLDEEVGKIGKIYQGIAAAIG